MNPTLRVLLEFVEIGVRYIGCLRRIHRHREKRRILAHAMLLHVARMQVRRRIVSLMLGKLLLGRDNPCVLGRVYERLRHLIKVEMV